MFKMAGYEHSYTAFSKAKSYLCLETKAGDILAQNS